MLKTIIILVILAVVIFALTLFYKPSRLELTPNMVILKVGTKDFNFPYGEIRKDSKNFSNIDVIQYRLTSSEETMIFESATITGLYEFSYNPKEIIFKLFDVKESQSIFSKNGLEALQLTLKNNQKINMFVAQQDSQELQLFYGISDNAFSKSVEHLVGRGVVPLKSSAPSEPLSRWSTKVNDMDGIISSIDH
jgi:hypothetical protein